MMMLMLVVLLLVEEGEERIEKTKALRFPKLVPRQYYLQNAMRMMTVVEVVAARKKTTTIVDLFLPKQ